MKISCKVVEDMLPLYVEDCCSEDTKQLLNEHLMECEDCKENLEKLKQPMFLPQELCMNEKTYAKHAKKAFKKLRRRWVVSILIILIIMLPLTWLGVNEIKGDGVSYSNLTYVLKGNALLRALQSDDYEKAFSYLNLKAAYEWETKFDETDMDSQYKKVEIGGDNFYIDDSTYNNEYRSYMEGKDDSMFWLSICLKKDYMIPVQKAELYLNDIEDIEKPNFLEYKVNGNDYYINGDTFNNDVNNVGNSLFRIMPVDYYNQVKKQIKEEEKRVKDVVQNLLDQGYDGYVNEYKQQWIDNFKQLKQDGVTIVDYELTSIYDMEEKYQLDYRLKLNVNGKINYDYGVTFFANSRGFYPGGGFVSGSSMEDDRIPIINAFLDTFEVE